MSTHLLRPLDGEVVAPLPRPPSQPGLITTSEQAIATARALAADFATGAAARDRDRRLPWEELDRYTATGLGTLTVPKAYGGPDLPLTTVVEVFEILSAADGSLGQIPQNQYGVVALLREAEAPHLKAQIFADLLAGHRIGNAGPERGSKPITHVTTTLRDTARGPRLSGRRYYSTGALFAHWIPSRAVNEAGEPLQVWVRRDAHGVSVIDDWDGFGQRTTASGTVLFDDVAVDPALVLPLAPLSAKPGLSGPISQLIQAAIDSGIAEGAILAAQEFVRSKTRAWSHSGVARAEDDPYIIAEFGRLWLDLHAAQAVLRRAAATLDRIGAAPVTAETSAEASVAVAEAKILTTEIAVEAGERLLELAGSSATREGPNLGRFWRDARVHTLHDPVRWKYHLLGAFTLNGTAPARHQWN